MGIATVLYLVCWSILLYYFNDSMAEHGNRFITIASRMITQMGLQISSMLIALLTIMLGAGAIASELETGIVHSIISRPIPRYQYVLGKLAGLTILATIYATILFTFILGIGALFDLPTIIDLSFFQIVKGWLVYILVPIAILTITLYGSASLKTVPNGILMICIYILGNAGGIAEMVGKYINSTSITSAGIFVSLISPFHTIFITAERILMPSSGITEDLMRGAGGLSGSGNPASIWMYVYIGIYLLGFVMLTIRKFGRKDIV